MTHTNEFNYASPAEFTSAGGQAGLPEPGVAHTQEECTVTYNDAGESELINQDPLIWKNKELASAGDIVMANTEGSMRILDMNNRDKCNSVSGWEPIAVVVVPFNHSGDGTIRAMSLKYMSTNSPETGSATRDETTCNMPTFFVQGIPHACYWPVYGAAKDNYTITVSQAQNCGQATQAEAYYNLISNDPLSGYLLSPYVVHPYDRNGLPNEDFHQWQLADMDGEANTNLIINVYQNSTFAGNTSSSTNYPAAYCCKKYSTTGTKAGDWYLPSWGEGQYIMSRSKQICRSINATGQSTVNTSVQNQMGIACSAQMDNNGELYVCPYNGNTGVYPAASTWQYECVRAFIKIEV